MNQPATHSPETLLPYGISATTGSGGRLRDCIEDFIVEEEPLYHPVGEGEHLYLWVEKKNLSTTSAVRLLLGKLGLPPIAAGFAGRKDTRAITRQWLSFHTPVTPDPTHLDGDGIRVLSVGRHENKLRKGHLAGNRFTIMIRGVSPDFDPSPLLEQLAREGFPNYFGMQRMGTHGENPQLGKRLIFEGSGRRLGGERARFAINAYQSACFNQLVAKRLVTLGDLATLHPGDYAMLHRNRAVFQVTTENLNEAQQRANQAELSASALLPGYQAPQASGLPGSWEQELLAREKLTPEIFRKGSKKHSPKGERRSVRMFPANLLWETTTDMNGRNLKLTFSLPKGTYATSFLREVMRNDDLSGYLIEPMGEHA